MSCPSRKSGTGKGRPLIRRGVRRDTIPPEGGRLFGRLEAAPTGCLRPIRRGAHCAPAVFVGAARWGIGPYEVRAVSSHSVGAGLAPPFSKKRDGERKTPSSVAACAVTPSPWRGEGFGGAGPRGGQPTPQHFSLKGRVWAVTEVRLGKRRGTAPSGAILHTGGAAVLLYIWAELWYSIVNLISNIMFGDEKYEF